jgi:hypothetical protein
MDEFKLSPPWKNAVKVLIEAGLTYGSTLEKEKIIDLCELVRPTTIGEKEKFDLKLLQCTSEIKEALLVEHQMMLVTNRDGSYRVVAPKDQTAHAIESGAKSIAKELQRMACGVQYVNTALLDDAQRKQNADALAKISMLAGMQKLANRELRQIIE